MRRVGRVQLSLLFLLAVVLLALAGGSSLAAAQDSQGDVKVEVLQIGWDGNTVPWAWSPLRLRVTGGSMDLNPTLEVILTARIPSGPQGTLVEYPMGAYGQDVALPAGVSKEVTLWLPASGEMGGVGTSGTIALSAGGRVLSEQKIEFKAAGSALWPLVGVLADSPSVARSVSQIELPFQGLPILLTAARLSAADLPTSGEKLGGLSALLVQGSAASGLTGEQRRAVQEWVNGGGHLLLLAAPDAARTAAILPDGVLPVTFSGADSSADLSPIAALAGPQPALPPGPAARFSSDSGSVLAGTRETPLAWRLGLGQGSVTLLAVDPSMEPLASWPGTQLLLRRALEPALPSGPENEKMRYIRMQEGDVTNRLRGSLEALPPGVFPDWRMAALLLGGFAVLAGPMIHLLLRRSGRGGLVWLAVPAAAVAVSALLYFVGVGREGRDVVVNVVSHIRLDPAGGPARQALAAGFYAPTHGELEVRVPGDTAVRVSTGSMGPVYTPGGVAMSPYSGPPFHVINGRDTRVEFDSGQWTMRVVGLTRSLGTEVGQVTASVALDGGLIKGTVRNDTPFLLEDAALALGQSLVKLGALAPGQAVPVTLDPGAGSAAGPYRGGYSLSWQLFARPLSSGGSSSAIGYGVASSISPVISRAVVAMPGMPGMAEPMELPQEPEIQRRVRLLDPLINSPSFGPGGPSLPLTFIAFTQAAVGSDVPSAGNHPAHFLSLVEERVSLDLPPGPFVMPSSLVTAEVLEQTGGYGMGSTGTLTWMDLRSGSSATYGFRLPLPSRAAVETLVLSTRQMSGSGAPAMVKGPMPPPMAPTSTTMPAEEGVFSLYNWPAARWDPVPAGGEETRIAAAAYVGPEGLVKVQMTAPGERQVYAVVPELGAEGVAQ